MWRDGANYVRVGISALVVALLLGVVLALVVPGRAGRLLHQPPQARLTQWSGGSDPGLHVLPFPGTPDASQLSQVVFMSLTPSDLRSVNVVGSLSGRHAGHIVALPDGSGAAFVPDSPFIDSETVRVSARLRSAAAGTASGAPGARRLRFSFGVAAPVASAVTVTATKSTSAGNARSYPPSEHFHSMPGLRPQVIRTTRDPDRTSGDIFLTPAGGRQQGPMILDSRGRLVWFDHISNGDSVYNLEVKTYRRKPVLTWWQGKFVGGHGEDGRDVIMDDSYRVLKVLRAGNGYSSDLHEFQLTPQGTAWVDCFVPVHANLTSQGGSANGTVLDGVIQKIDVRTGKLLWEWHLLGHVPIIQAHYGAAGGGTYDAFHLNSIQELPNGKVLISVRNTWALYLVDERTGRIDWTLGGKDSSFREGPGAGFEWQHDAVLHSHGLLTVFDDAAGPPDEESESSAKELRIDVHTRTVSLVRRFTHSPPLTAIFQGSAQLLPNRNMFVAWGDKPSFSEYSRGGRQIFNGSFLDFSNSYRVYRFPWDGQPVVPPAIALAPGSDGATKVYSAWNGATGVARWRVLGGAARDALASLGQAASVGFETGQWIHAEPRYFAVEAVDARGKVLGRSTPVGRPASVAVYGQDAFVSASTGAGTVPVACFTVSGRSCSVTAALSTGKRVLAKTSAESLVADRGGLLNFRLSSAGRQMLAGARSQRLVVQLTARDSSGHAARRRIELIRFTTGGPGPRRSLLGSGTIRLLGTTEFVSHNGRGSIVAACQAAVRCRVQGSVSAGGQTIATLRPTNLGANEVGQLPFQLTSGGATMLAAAAGNQLAVRVRVHNGADVATGQVALVGYG